MQKGLASRAPHFLGIRAAASQLCLGLDSISDLWEPYFGPPSLDLIMTPGFCPRSTQALGPCVWDIMRPTIIPCPPRP